MTHFFLCLGVDPASFRGRPLGRLSFWAGLPAGVATDPPAGGEDPLSEESRIFSSDDILIKRQESRRTIREASLRHFQMVTFSIPLCFRLRLFTCGLVLGQKWKLSVNQDLILRTVNRYNCQLDTAVHGSTRVNSRLSQPSKNCYVSKSSWSKSSEQTALHFDSLPELIQSQMLSGLNWSGS